MRLAICLAVAAAFIWTPALASDTSAIAQAYGADGAAKVLTSAETILNKKASPADAPNGTALQCFADEALVPYFGDRAVTAMRDAADTLVAISGAGKGGDVGWTIAPEHVDACGVPGEQNILHRGCNPVGTKYTFRTALALTCVAHAYLVTRDKRYLDAAKAAVVSSWPHGAPTPGCADCFYYWKSYSPRDTGRYVRNVNVLMGMALGAVYRADDDAATLARVRQIANSEKMDLAAGNEGYFSVVDPQFRADPARERGRIENHVPYVAIGLLEIGKTLDDPALIAGAAKVEASWTDCASSVCGGKTCKQWGGDPASCDVKQQASVCFFRKTNAAFADKCRAFVLAERKLDAYEMWAALSGVAEAQ